MKRIIAGALCLCLCLAGCGGTEGKNGPDAPSAPAASPAAAAPSPSAAGTGRDSSAPAGPVETATPSPAPSPTPSAVPADQAELVAGEDYDFTQPVPESRAVDEAYFDDAAFIGDSRTDGFRLYSGILNGDFMVKTGLSVFHVDTDQITYDGEKMTVLQALGRKQYGKVYISLGVNELGMYNDKGYHDHFAKLVDDVKAQQPDATVYIQLLIPVNTQKCAEKKIASYINNQQLAVYNDLLHQVAEEKHVFLVDPAEELTDETGEPPYDSVADGVHFNKAPYQQWLDYLKRHTIDKGEWT